MTATTTAMPRWLKDHLIQTGTMTGDGVTWKARPRHCRRCRAVILAALADDTIRAEADPVPLTIEGEALALLAGRTTYTLHKSRGDRELWIRDALMILDRPPGCGNPLHPYDSYDVLPAHRCTDQTLESFAAPTWRTANDYAALSDEPEF